MVRYKVALFDLDGTLIDPKVGITQAVQYALRKLSIEVTDLDDLVPFIGPPLSESFEAYYALDAAATARAIGYYREYFADSGIWENTLYPGMVGLLSRLREVGMRLAVATSKPTDFAEPILGKFGIRRYFEVVIGSHLDNTRSSKTDIIAAVLRQFPSIGRPGLVMVGDREHDVIGARNNGIDSVAVTYGYGSVQELSEAGATHLAHTLDELRSILLA